MTPQITPEPPEEAPVPESTEPTERPHLPATRDAYVAQRRRWLQAAATQEEERQRLAELTHRMLDLHSAQDLADWLEEALGDDLGQHGVRHWDVTHHRRVGLPRRHPAIKRSPDDQPAG